MSTPTDEARTDGGHRSALRARTRIGIVMAALLFAVTGLGIAHLWAPERQHEDAVREIASSLRCPTCEGEDVADSAAPVAQSMRLVIAEQVREGRTPAQIREWFAARYGTQVLLEPPARQIGLLVWLGPVVIIGLGAALVAHRGPWRRARTVTAAVSVTAVGVAVIGWLLVPAGSHSPAPGGDPATPDPTLVLADAVDRSPGNVQLHTVLASRLEAEERFDEAARQYAAVARLRPLDAEAHYRHAFALLRADDPEEASVVLRQTLGQHPDHPASLLLLGTLLHRQREPDAVPLLRRFVAVAPDDPAADQVTEWLQAQESEQP